MSAAFVAAGSTCKSVCVVLSPIAVWDGDPHTSCHCPDVCGRRWGTCEMMDGVVNSSSTKTPSITQRSLWVSLELEALHTPIGIVAMERKVMTKLNLHCWIQLLPYARGLAGHGRVVSPSPAGCRCTPTRNPRFSLLCLSFPTGGCCQQ